MRQNTTAELNDEFMTNLHRINRFHLKVSTYMIRNFVQNLLDFIAKITYNRRIFITVFFVEIFNFIGYANNTTCDIFPI